MNGYNPTHLDGAGDILESVAQAFNAPVSDFDLDTILTQIAPEVTTRKILLVGHSQGTFYTNELYDYLVKNGVPAQSIAVYNLATPASFVAGGGAYLTSANDKVINYVRETDAEWNAPQALPANIIVPEEPGYADDAWGGHALETYLGGAPQKIVSDIENALAKLSAGPDAAGGCFAPPSLGISYDVQQAAFDAADPAVVGLDAAATDARETIASVANNENTILHEAFSDVVFSIIPQPTAQNAADAFAIEKALYGSSLSVQDYEALVNGQDVPEVSTVAQNPSQTSQNAQPPQPQTQPARVQSSEETQPPQPASPAAMPAGAAVRISISPGFGGGAPKPPPNSETSTSPAANPTPSQRPTNQTDATTTQQATSTQASAPATTTLALSILSPADQTTFSTTSVAFTGTTSGGATVFATFATTTATTTADDSGNWSLDLQLHEGTTTVFVSATDDSGDSSATSTRAVGVALAQPAASSTETSALVEVPPQNPCGQSSLAANGYFFSAAKDDADYSGAGYLEYHFEDQSQYSDGRPFKLTWQFFDDQCLESGPQNPPKLTITLPANVTDWSVRFTSQTHFDVWDDADESIVAQYDIPAQLPTYTSIQLIGSIDGSASTLVSRGLEIFQNGEVPSIAGSIAAPSGCASGVASGYFFDSYEHAEYVGGLLRVHLRLLSPYNDGRPFLAAAAASGTCPLAYPALTGAPQTSLTPFIRYYSFRMTSATHWVLWDDENDVQIACAEGCEGDTPAGANYVSFYASVDAGASTLRTTPYAPTGG